MSRVTLICTRHEEHGNCNSSQLLEIVESIKPMVIFEELSQSNFDNAYNHGTVDTLETATIKRYLVENDIPHIPVDTFPRNREYEESIDGFYEGLGSSGSYEAFQWRNLIAQQQDLIGTYGFDFLNCSGNDYCLNKLDSLKTTILANLKDERAYHIHRSEIEMNEKREDEILKNIYSFSKERNYNDGIMFIGSGHRRSVLPMIKRFEDKEEVKLNWRFYHTDLSKYLEQQFGLL